MTMDKLKMHSPDLSQDNIAKIRDLFPGCVTEARDEVTGVVRLAVDFDQLRQELSDHIVEGPQERYRLDWPGKREALIAANSPISKTLRPAQDESLDFDTTKNRSRAWCEWGCGNKAKTRNYRARKKAAGS